jgi:hypothetical protein
MDAADTLTGDLSVEKPLISDYNDRLKNCKDRINELKLTNANLNGRLSILSRDDSSTKAESKKKGLKSKKIDATPPPPKGSYGGKGIPSYGQK